MLIAGQSFDMLRQKINPSEDCRMIDIRIPLQAATTHMANSISADSPVGLNFSKMVYVAMSAKESEENFFRSRTNVPVLTPLHYAVHHYQTGSSEDGDAALASNLSFPLEFETQWGQRYHFSAAIEFKVGHHYRCSFIVRGSMGGALVRPGLYEYDGMKNGGNCRLSKPLAYVNKKKIVHEVLPSFKPPRLNIENSFIGHIAFYRRGRA